MKEFAIGLFISSIIFFMGFFFFSKIQYKHKYKTNYDIRNMFPYEHNFNKEYVDNIFGNILFVLFNLCSIGFYVIVTQEGFTVNNYFILMIAAILHIVASLFLIFIPLNLIKVHLFDSLLSMVLSVAHFGALAFVSLSDYQILLNPADLVIGIISLVFTLISFGIIMNPKLNNKISYVEVKNEDGSISYKRPKYFVLAFSEWLSIFMVPIAMILTLIFYLI
jgi:hypothetical protein